MSRRDENGKFAKAKSKKRMGLSWVVWLASIFLLYAAGGAVIASFASLQSCSHNNTGLVVNSCGKQSLNVGDIILIGLFIASAALAVSMFTAAWRITKKTLR